MDTGGDVREAECDPVRALTDAWWSGDDGVFAAAVETVLAGGGDRCPISAASLLVDPGERADFLGEALAVAARLVLGGGRHAVLFGVVLHGRSDQFPLLQWTELGAAVAESMARLGMLGAGDAVIFADTAADLDDLAAMTPVDLRRLLADLAQRNAAPGTSSRIDGGAGSAALEGVGTRLLLGCHLSGTVPSDGGRRIRSMLRHMPSWPGDDRLQAFAALAGRLGAGLRVAPPAEWPQVLVEAAILGLFGGLATLAAEHQVDLAAPGMFHLFMDSTGASAGWSGAGRSIGPVSVPGALFAACPGSALDHVRAMLPSCMVHPTAAAFVACLHSAKVEDAPLEREGET